MLLHFPTVVSLSLMRSVRRVLLGVLVCWFNAFTAKEEKSWIPGCQTFTVVVTHSLLKERFGYRGLEQLLGVVSFNYNVCLLAELSSIFSNLSLSDTK